MLKITNSLPLFCLAYAVKPVSGYDITKQISDSWSHQHVYKDCKKLHKAGLLDCRLQHNGGKPDTKFYTLTDFGRQQTRAYVEEFKNTMALGKKTPRHLLAALVQVKNSDIITSSELKEFLVVWHDKLVDTNSVLQNHMNDLKKAGKLSVVKQMLLTDKIADNQTKASSISHALNYYLV